MKRGAEKQLTKDTFDDGDDDIEEISEPLGFQKADESALAKRQIRALPKRALTGPKPPPLNGLPSTPLSDADNAEVLPPPKFGGFVGFGAVTSPSNPFTFTAQPSPASSDTEPEPTHPPPIPAPPSLFGSPKPFLSATDAKPATVVSAEETDAVAFKYYKSLRGLNVSFLSAISAAVESDPFFDVANLVESYKNLRTTIQSEFDGSPEHTSVMTTSASPPSVKPISGKNAFFLPKSFGALVDSSSKPAPTTESGPKPGGFTFSPFVPPTSSTLTQSPPGATSNSSETPSVTVPPEPSKSAFGFGTSKTSVSSLGSPPTSGFSFAIPPSFEGAAVSMSDLRPSSQETEGPSTILSAQPDSTASAFGSSSVPNFFSNTRPSTSDVTPKPPSIFGSSIFGSGNAIDSSKPSLFTSSSSDGKDVSKFALFGSTTASSSTSTSIFGSSDKSPTVFGSASQPKPSTFIFGKPGGSIGNPVGFGFGGVAPGDSTAPSSGFNFGSPPVKPSESLFSPPPTDKSTESTPQPDAEGNEEGGEEGTSKLLPAHTHDEEGEGEEEEETTHVSRCKVYRLSKSEDKNEWKDLGIGMFRLKRHTVTNIRRALMRNSSTGRILLNFRIYAGLKPSLAKNSISFIGYENDTPVSFRIRFKTEEQAGEFKVALEREVALVQAVA